MNVSFRITLPPGVDIWIWACAIVGTSAGAVMIVVLLWHRFFKRLPQQLVFASSTAQFLFAASQLAVSIWAISVSGRLATFSECAGISSVRFVALGLSNLGNSAILFAFYYMIKSVRHFTPISWRPLKLYLIGMGSFVAFSWALLVVAFTTSVNWAYLSTGFCVPIPKSRAFDNPFLSMAASSNSLVPMITGIILFGLAFRERRFFLQKKAELRLMNEQNEPSTAVDELCGYFNFYRALAISWFICQFPFGLSVILGIPLSTVPIIRLARILTFQWQGVQPLLDLTIYLYYLPGPFAQRGLGSSSRFTRGTRTTTVDTNSNGASKDTKSEQDSPKYKLPVTPLPEAGKQEV